MAAPLAPQDPRVSRSPQPRDDHDAASPAEQILVLTAELQERDRLVELLTERLEQAAEQLDRIHRSGGDRGARPGGGGGLSGEAAERQAAVTDRLEALLESWEQAQAPALLERIDLRLDKLVQLLRDGGGTADEHPEPQIQRASSPAASPGSGPEGWAELKAKLLKDQPAGAAPVSVATPSTLVASAAPAAATVEQEPEEAPIAEPPAAVSEGETDPQVLTAAVQARDAYIVSLINEFRRYRRLQPIDWESVKDCPEELRQRLERLEHRLDQELKREELALSLERARLAREQAQLEQLRTRLDKEIRRLGSNAPADADEQEGSSWTRMFGRKK
jgi:hypothetical protein